MWELIVKPLMVRVSTFVHMVVFSIGKLTANLKIPAMPNFQMAVRAKQDAITEGVSTFVLSNFMAFCSMSKLLAKMDICLSDMVML